MPQERKLWILRKNLYGGIPPTDPRILAMTDEQIELEFAHMLLDKQLSDKASGGHHYEDPDYDEYDAETDEMDSMLSYAYDVPSHIDLPKPDAEDDWEDVE